MILLTDEEIERARQEGLRTHYADVARGFIREGVDVQWYEKRGIAKAQLKKVIGRIQDTSRRDELDGAVFRKIYINDEEWQALLKEIDSI